MMATVEEHFGRSDWFDARADSESSRVFQAMLDLPSGGLLRYTDLDRVLGGRDFRSNRTPWFNALNRWHREVKSGTKSEAGHALVGTWKVVPKIGYQHVPDWKDVKGTGQVHEKRMRKQARKSKQRYLSADLSKMTNDERTERSELLTRVGRLEQAMRSQKADIKVLRKTKAEKSDVAALQDQVQALTEKIDKIANP